MGAAKGMSLLLLLTVYCACSSLMLILNKLAVYHIGAPAVVTLAQFAWTAAAVRIGKSLGWIEVDPFEWSKVKFFLIYVLAFAGGTWSNMRILMDSNVETVIVFRSCAPVAVCVFDYWFHKRALPGARSALAMLLISAGATAYVLTDRDFLIGGVSAYFWVGVWFVLLIFQLTYAKYLVSSIGLTSAWSAVLYTNSLSMVPTAIIGATGNDFSTIARFEWTRPAVVWLVLSCLLGLGISWTGFKCQQMITATAYTVVGVMNKMITVLVNVLMWDNHASMVGIGSLVICLLGGSLYQQAPLRREYRDDLKNGQGAPLISSNDAAKPSV